MNSRLMQLKIRGEDHDQSVNEESAIVMPVIKGVIPKVSGIVSVTPQMLKDMLGVNYLN